MNIQPLPALVSSKSSATLLEEVPLMASYVDESTLQEILRVQPGLLPVVAFDPICAPCVCIGREVATNAGSIDNLYISPQGYLTLVETKLWRNPEARRRVVAQILDYAKEISRWDYDHVDGVARAYFRQYEGVDRSLFDHVKLHAQDEMEEQAFHDGVSRCLEHGRTLNLVVGDGIQENTAQLVEHLNRFPRLSCVVGLIELKLYRLQSGSDWPLVAVPRVVLQTETVEKAVVTIEMGDELRKLINLDVKVPETSTKPGVRRGTLSEEEFYDQVATASGREATAKLKEFIDDVCEKLPYVRELGTSGMTLKFQHPQDPGNPGTVLRVSDSGELTSWDYLRVPKRFGIWKVPDQPMARFYAGLSAISTELAPKAWSCGGCGSKGVVKVSAVADRLMPEFRPLLAHLAEEIIAQTKMESE